MKAKLIKDDDGYSLYVQKKESTNREFIASTNGMYVKHKLSKQNCDEILGVVDLMKLAEERFGKSSHHANSRACFREGFNKALELNKDKLFTLEEIMLAWDAGVMSRSILGMFSGDLYAKHLKEHRDSYRQSLQQPTEMNVEIVMGDSIGISDLYTPHNNPKLDSSGCLILKRVV